MDIKFNIVSIEAGWINFEIISGELKFEGQFSHVFDPLIDFKHWLEAIASDEQETSFKYDSEGFTVKLNYEWIYIDNQIFTITSEEKEKNVLLQVDINRKQFVNTIYHEFLSVINLDKFQSKEWAVELVKESLCRIYQIELTSLVDEMIELDFDELKNLLNHADNHYSDFISQSLNLKYFVKNIEIENFKNDGWNIPIDYNYWGIQQKHNFIIECLNERISPYKGTKFKEFKSEIIEKYLELN